MTADDALYQLEHDLSEHYLDWGATMQAFKEAIADAGITPPDHVVADGLIHSFSTNGKGSDWAGRYCLFDDGLAAGWFMDWRTSIQGSWRHFI
jgi:phage/plasmid primase-like uncharacterized protein